MIDSVLRQEIGKKKRKKVVALLELTRGADVDRAL